MAVPVRAELIEHVEALELRLRSGQRRMLIQGRDRMRAAGAGLPRPAELLAIARQRHDHAASRFGAALGALVERKASRLAALTPRISAGALERRRRDLTERLVAMGARLGPAFVRRAERARARVDALARTLELVGYHKVLERGYALATDASGTVIRSVTELPPGTAFGLRLADGEIGARADGAAAPKARSPRTTPPKTGQKSLF
jgi:exodeoxyribonuclease VII large subunit